MSEVLYGPDGFYMTEATRAGTRGDFVTAPEVGELFAGAIAEELSPGMRVADVGGGRGTLAAALRDLAGVEAAVVEVSPACRRVAADDEGLVAADTLHDLPWQADVVIANELLDNLPARLVARSGEIVLGRGAEGFEWFRVPLDPRARAFAHRYVPADEGDEPHGCGIVGFPTAALDWLGTVDSTRLILFDYGDVAAALAARDEWPLRAYAGQRRVDPRSAAELDADVTVEVAVDVVADALRADRWSVTVTSQRAWLNERGVDNPIRSSEPAERTLASEAAALVDPRGLGGFFVIDATRR